MSTASRPNYRVKNRVTSFKILSPAAIGSYARVRLLFARLRKVIKGIILGELTSPSL